MRLIDADDVDNHIVGSVNLSGCPTINAIPIPDNATNGDVIKAMFPNVEINPDPYIPSVDLFFGGILMMRVDRNWWNAPYRGWKND